MSTPGWIPTVLGELTPEQMDKLANANRGDTQVVWTDGIRAQLNAFDLKRIKERVRPFAMQTWKHERWHVDQVGPFTVDGGMQDRRLSPDESLELAMMLAELQPNVILALLELAERQLAMDEVQQFKGE